MSSIRREADFYLIELPEPNFENMVIEVRHFLSFLLTNSFQVLQKVWTDNRQSEIQVTSPVIETNFIKLMESLGLQSIDTQCWFFRYDNLK